MKNLHSLIIVFLLISGFSRGQLIPPSSPLQGGENVATAFVLSGPLPITNTGTTAGYSDDYDEVCPYDGSTAPDVVYAYTPASSVIVDIDLCGSAYDTKIFIYENTVTPGIPFDCNDDYYFDGPCGTFVSKIEGASLTGGNTYYIVIDGYSSLDFGNYTMTISQVQPCNWGVDATCPAGAIPESETCGNDSNGGCNMVPGTESFESVPSTGGTICGTTWADGGDRDSDWFSLVLAQSASVILTANSDRQIFYGLVETAIPGSPSCATVTGFVNPAELAGPCNETSLDLGVLGPGTYWFYTSMLVYDGYPCNNHFWINFDVTPVTCASPDALYAGSISSGSADLGWTETGSATSWEYQYGPSGYTPAATGTTTSFNPVPVTGLTANTSYDFYVRASCGQESSSWSGPFTFTTLCGSFSSFPWSEGFESAWLPDCWSIYAPYEFGWVQSRYGSAYSGSEWAYCNLSGAKLTTPSFYLPSPLKLVFWFRVENADYPQDLTVSIGNNIIFQLTDATNDTYQQVQVPLTGYTGQTVSVSFTGGTGIGGADFGICLDDVSIRSGINTWTGNVSTAWNNTGNWDAGNLPGPDELIIIPSVPPGAKFPEISSGITADCHYIIIETGATIKVKTGGALNIHNP